MPATAYEHFSKGETVRIAIDTRICGFVDGEWEVLTEVPAGTVGVVESMTNAGFRGLEYSVRTAEGRVHGIGAAHLRMVETMTPVTPWHRQTTYRNGKAVRSAR